MTINVAINGGRDLATSSVTAGPGERHVITPEEAAAWGLTDDALKSAVALYKGKRPNDVFLHSPTPWGDLYKTYGWPEVTVNLDVRDARIVSLDLTPVVVATRSFTNESSVPATFTVGVTDQVAETATTTWNTTQTLGVTQTVKYGISFLGTGGGGETAFKYERAWAEGGADSTMVTIGSSTAATVTLQPHQSVYAELAASRGTLTVEVSYNAYLDGVVAVNYSDRYEGHHFYGLDVNSVAREGGIPRWHVFDSTVKVGYYSDAHVIVRDAATHEVVAHAPAAPDSVMA